MSIYAKGDTLSRKQPTLYHLQRYIGRDNNKLLAFWYYFGGSVMEAMYQSGQFKGKYLYAPYAQWTNSRPAECL